MGSLLLLPVEVLLLIEHYAKASIVHRERLIAPSLQLSWVCQHLRAVFMPRCWSFAVIGSTRSLAHLIALITSSPPDAFRQHVKYLEFGSIGVGTRLDAGVYWTSPTPSAGAQLQLGDRPNRSGDKFAALCGPRVGEVWPTPTQLVFNDPKRYFKLAGRRRERDVEDESDETGSSAASEAEEEERNCTECHPVMHQLYRHRVKPDDYWLPGAVHSIGPLQWNRRTWGRYSGPDRREGSGQISTIEAFTTAATFLVDQLNFEAFKWSAAFPMPRLLCEKLAHHPTFVKLGLAGYGGGSDCFSSLNPRDDLLLLAPNITVLHEYSGTAFGVRDIPLQRDDDEEDIPLSLTEYPEANSMRGFMDFLLATKQLKHLNAECTGVFATPCLLGVFARLHSLHWNTLTSEPYEHVVALSKLRTSLWQLAQAVNRPDHLLEAADVQLLADPEGEHADIAANVSALSDWLEQEELAALVAQGWNEQDERGPNESAVFYPPCLADSTEDVDCSSISTAYENPYSVYRW